MKRLVKIVLAFLVAVLVGFAVVYSLKLLGNGGKGHGSNVSPKPATNSSKTTSAPISDITGSGNITNDEPAVESTGLIEDSTPIIVPELVIPSTASRPKLVVGKSSYYYIISGIRVGGASDGINYVLSDNSGHRYTSENGTFNRVEANSTGTYTVVAQNTNSGLSSEPKTLRGFNILEPVQNKLTASELSSMVASGDYDGNKSKLDGKLAKTISINSSNGDYKRNTIQEVFMSVGLENWNVTITSLDYNCLGQVMGINLSAKR